MRTPRTLRPTVVRCTTPGIRPSAVLFLPTFLKDEIPQEHKDGLDMARDYLRRSHVLVVCGHGIDETVKNDIATAERLRITATTLDGILAVKARTRERRCTPCLSVRPWAS